MNKKVILSLVLVAVMAFGSAFATYAWFTSQATSANNVFAAGTLKVNLNTNLNSQGVEQPFVIGGPLQPGQVVTTNAAGTSDVFTVEIVNNGSLNMGYFDNFEISGNVKLAEAIYISEWSNEFLTYDKASNTYTRQFLEELINNDGKNYKYPDGHKVLDKSGDGRVSLAEWLSVDNFQMGLPYGWDIGALKPGAKFVSNFKLAFDPLAGNEYQGLTLNGKFKVVATQVNSKEPVKALLNTLSLPTTDSSVNNAYDWMMGRLSK